MKVVLDTNVIVSALILQGPTNQLTPLWQEGKFALVVSKPVIQEYLRVLTYPKFKLSIAEIKFLIEQQIAPFAQPVNLKDIPNVIKEDPSDNIFLGTAAAGKCDYLISGDRHLLKLHAYKDIPIISPSVFLSKLTT